MILGKIGNSGTNYLKKSSIFEIFWSELEINLANISRALSELERKEIVVCHTPEKRVGKIYTLTKKGVKTSETIKDMEKT